MEPNPFLHNNVSSFGLVGSDCTLFKHSCIILQYIKQLNIHSNLALFLCEALDTQKCHFSSALKSCTCWEPSMCQICASTNMSVSPNPRPFKEEFFKKPEKVSSF